MIQRLSRLVLVVFLISVSAMLSACDEFGFFFPPSDVEPEQLVGTWLADYGPYRLVDSYEHAFIEIVETIELSLDGSFRQLVDNEEISSGEWRLDSDGSVHLVGAYILTDGFTVAERLKHGEGGIYAIGCHNDLIQVDGSELILCVLRARKVPGGIVLRHLGVGDPDSPIEIKFYRVDEN